MGRVDAVTPPGGPRFSLYGGALVKKCWTRRAGRGKWAAPTEAEMKLGHSGAAPSRRLVVPGIREKMLDGAPAAR